jgi:hypothetical protein
MALNTRIPIDNLNQDHIDIIFECYGMTGLPLWEEGTHLDVEQIKRGFERKGYFIAIPHPTESENNFLAFSPAIDPDDGITYLHLGLVPNDYKGDKGHLHRTFNKEIIRSFFN